MIYANGAQQILLMNGLQYFKNEKVESNFSGEGSHTDALPNCVATGKPSLALPCLGERGFGNVNSDEMVIALPADRLLRTVDGLKALKKTGLTYPINWTLRPVSITEIACFLKWVMLLLIVVKNHIKHKSRTKAGLVLIQIQEGRS